MKVTNTLDLNNFKATNLANGVNPQDAVTVSQLDLAKKGIKRKDTVRTASTGNLSLSGTQTINGVALLVNDRVLVKDQTNAADNGIYIVQSGSWVRSTDFSVSEDIVGSEVFVSEGTISNKVYSLTTDAPIVIGTTNLVFSLFGDGITYTGGTGITINSSTISIDSSVVCRKTSATIGDGTSTTITVTHNLNTQHILVSVIEVATNTGVLVDFIANTVNTVQLVFGIAPSIGQYQVTIVG